MRTVRKFHISQDCRLNIPEGAVILRAGRQGSDVVLWVDVDDTAPPESRVFCITGTGHAVPDGARYVGGVSQPPFEWHIWEVLDAR